MGLICADCSSLSATSPCATCSEARVKLKVIAECEARPADPTPYADDFEE